MNPNSIITGTGPLALAVLLGGELDRAGRGGILCEAGGQGGQDQTGCATK